MRLPTAYYKKEPQLVAEKPRVNGYSAALEGLFLGFEKKGYPSAFGLSFCGLTEDNFLDVYHEWKHGRVHPIVPTLKAKAGFKVDTPKLKI